MSEIPEPKREFLGIFISSFLWFDKSLSPMEKFLLAEIESLGGTRHGCYARNAYLGKMLSISPKTVANMLTKLRKAKYVEETTGRNGQRLLFSKYPFNANHYPEVREHYSRNEGEIYSLFSGDSFPNNGKQESIERKNKEEKSASASVLLPQDEGKQQGLAKQFPFMDQLDSDLCEALLTVVGFCESWREFVANRSEMGHKLTKRSAAPILTELAKRPTEAAGAIKTATEKGWRGFKWDWIDAEHKRNGILKNTSKPAPKVFDIRKRPIL